MRGHTSPKRNQNIFKGFGNTIIINGGISNSIGAVFSMSNTPYENPNKMRISKKREAEDSQSDDSD